MRQLQIGVIGSTSDLRYSKKTTLLAQRIGQLIAFKGCTLLFGAEKDSDSLSTIAARFSRRDGGITVGFTYGTGKKVFDKSVSSIVIPTGLDRGGGREFVLVSSCDVVIGLSGGSGTLSEIAIAYQLGIPVIILQGTGGWVDKLTNSFLDERERLKIIGVETAEKAVDLAIVLAQEKLNKLSNNKEIYENEYATCKRSSGFGPTK
jgi:uncharacterized protein (TIGR00725 family)